MGNGASIDCTLGPKFWLTDFFKFLRLLGGHVLMNIYVEIYLAI